MNGYSDLAHALAELENLTKGDWQLDGWPKSERYTVRSFGSTFDIETATTPEAAVWGLVARLKEGAET